MLDFLWNIQHFFLHLYRAKLYPAKQVIEIKTYKDMIKDHFPLNDDLFPNLEKNQLAVGIGFGLFSQPCTEIVEFEGKKYKRLHTEAIPMVLASDICSVQIYELTENYTFVE